MRHWNSSQAVLVVVALVLETSALATERAGEVVRGWLAPALAPTWVVPQDGAVR